MDKVTQSNAANAEESASASEELSAQARELNEMVDTLVAIVGGSAAKSHAAGSGDSHVAATAAGRPQARAGRQGLGKMDTALHNTWTQGKQAPAGRTAKADKQASTGGTHSVKPQVAIPLNDAELQQF
jgi:hypothetical protein